MGWVFYYAVLLILLGLSSAYAAGHTGTLPTYVRALAGVIPILSALAQAITKVNFRAYLWSQELWIALHGSATSNWRFGIRLDGSLGTDVISRITQTLKDNPRWSPRLVRTKPAEVKVVVDRTIHLTITYEPEAESGDGEDHLLIHSDELEVTYASAKRKIDTCIVPFMTMILRNIPSRQSSTMLEVFFSSKNPFFAFFVAHLRPEQVSQFKLVFRPAAITRNESDKVLVTKQSISINAQSPDAFASLSKAFLLLSEDAATLNTI